MNDEQSQHFLRTVHSSYADQVASLISKLADREVTILAQQEQLSGLGAEIASLKQTLLHLTNTNGEGNGNQVPPDYRAPASDAPGMENGSPRQARRPKPELSDTSTG